MDEYTGFWVTGKGSGLEGWARFGTGYGDGAMASYSIDGNAVGSGYGSGGEADWGDETIDYREG